MRQYMERRGDAAMRNGGVNAVLIEHKTEVWNQHVAENRSQIA